MVNLSWETSPLHTDREYAEDDTIRRKNSRRPLHYSFCRRADRSCLARHVGTLSDFD